MLTEWTKEQIEATVHGRIAAVIAEREGKAPPLAAKDKLSATLGLFRAPVETASPAGDDGLVGIPGIRLGGQDLDLEPMGPHEQAEHPRGRNSMRFEDALAPLPDTWCWG